MLFYVEHCVQDGVMLPTGGKRVISKQIHFVEIKEDGTAKNAGYAPYLDYRSPSEAEQKLVHTFLRTQSWLQGELEEIAKEHASVNIVPEHIKNVRARQLQRIDKTIRAVKERLTAEIQYWDFRAAELKQKESIGKINAKLNSQMAARRAEDLQARMQKIG